MDYDGMGWNRWNRLYDLNSREFKTIGTMVIMASGG